MRLFIGIDLPEVVLFESRAIGGKRTYMNLYNTSLYPQI